MRSLLVSKFGWPRRLMSVILSSRYLSHACSIRFLQETKAVSRVEMLCHIGVDLFKSYWGRSVAFVMSEMIVAPSAIAAAATSDRVHVKNQDVATRRRVNETLSNTCVVIMANVSLNASSMDANTWQQGKITLTRMCAATPESDPFHAKCLVALTRQRRFLVSTSI